MTDTRPDIRSDARATDRLDGWPDLDATVPHVFPSPTPAPTPSPSPTPTPTPVERVPSPRPAGTAPRPRAVETLPAGDLVLSLVGLGPIPARHVATAPRLHDERLRADLPDGTDDHTPLEAALRLRTEVAAERWLARRTRSVLDPAARRLTALSARHREVTRRLERSGEEPIADTTGRTVTRDEAQATADRLSVAIEESLDSGSEQHRTARCSDASTARATSPSSTRRAGR
jgi:hypothetical protein